jgi:hypothetical protein
VGPGQCYREEIVVGLRQTDRRRFDQWKLVDELGSVQGDEQAMMLCKPADAGRPTAPAARTPQAATSTAPAARAELGAALTEVALPAPQLIAAQIAVSCCASRAACGPETVGRLERYRVPLGPDMDALARRLRGIRAGDPAQGARPWPRLRLVSVAEPSGGPVELGAQDAVQAGAIASFTTRELALLTAAAHRLRGLLADAPDGVDEDFADQVDAVTVALLDTLAAAC